MGCQFIGVLEPFMCPVIEVPDYWDDRVIGVPNYWGTELLRCLIIGCRAIRVPYYWGTGLLGCLIIGVQGYWGI